VGVVFLLTGCIKALAPSSMIRYFVKLGVTDLTRLRIIVWVSAVAECVLGAALVARAFPSWLFPGTVVLCIAFVVLTAWNRDQGEDCACYGKLLALSPAKSIALDLFYAALAIVAWRIPAAGFLPVSGQIAVLSGAGVLFSAGATLAHRYYFKQGEDWLDLNPVQVGRKWNSDWLEGFAAVANREMQLIILMSPTCPFCKVWIKPLNKVSRRADMPQIIAAMAASEDEIRAVAVEHGIAFPVLRVKPSVMNRIASRFPDVVLVENGVVRGKPGARIPEDLIQRLKNSTQTAGQESDSRAPGAGDTHLSPTAQTEQGGLVGDPSTTFLSRTE
jgi:hypothetical protein